MWGESTPNGFSNFSLVSKSRPQKIFRQLSTLLHSPSPDTKERRGMEQWESCAEVPPIDLLPQYFLWYQWYHIISMFHPFQSRQILKKNFSCFRFVLKYFMQHLPKKRESVFPRPPNIECMRYTSKCPHDAEYPRVKRNQLLTLSRFFRARIRNQDDTWRRSWAIVGAKIAVKVGPSFCNLASFKRRNLLKFYP